MKNCIKNLLIAVAFIWGTLSCAAVCKVLTVEGVIDPVVADYVDGGLAGNDFDIAVIAMNTPGGLMESMQDIVRAMLNCPKPVCVWIGPSGARAASAGVFITVAADFAAMATATNIGAAHPVQMGMGKEGGDAGKSDMMEKIVNDAVAYIQAIAKERGRPLEWVKDAVEKSVSIGSAEAQKMGIVDYVVDDIDGFLKLIHGKEIEKKGTRIVINTKDIAVKYESMTAWKDFLHKIANPNIAFILMMIGIWGIIQEASSPGIGFGAAVGGISLLLAFFSMRILPINIVGLLLIVLGIILLFLEMYTPAFGILIVGGLISFTLGGMMLIDRARMTVGVSLGTILPSAVLLALFMIIVVGAVIKSQRKKTVTGRKGMIGTVGVVREKISGTGMVFVHGEIWLAKSAREIEKGVQIRIIDIEGNTLKVEECE